MPSPYYYRTSNIVEPFSFPDTIPWDEKIPKLYWRGTASGGRISGNTTSGTYHHFPRFRLHSLAANNSHLIDARITSISLSNCRAKFGCDKQAILDEYGIEELAEKEPRERSYEFKYVLDLDGNSFSGRYLDLLRTGSVVFKSTIFTEFFSDWFKPYVHYIPVLPDLSDLVEQVQWAIDNEEEARTIGRTGRAMADLVITDDQVDCYSFAVLLEWGRLYNG